jgi:hypothetical protein
MKLAALGALLLALAAPAAAAPPAAGQLVPGRSLGGLRLGQSKAEVRETWGLAYGVCRGCGHETWYFNAFAFRPAGAGVELRNGKVAAIFTVYQPAGWRTSKGLVLGDPVARVTALYGALTRVECDGYYALVLPRDRTLSAFYVLGERLWAFGLSASGVAVCR